MFLVNKATGAVTENLQPESVEYQSLIAQRDSTNPAKTVWESIAEEDIGSAVSRVIVILEPGAAVGADETVSTPVDAARAGTITSAAFVANADIIGANTNTRTITVTQDNITGTTSPARVITTLATLALTAGVNAAKGANTVMTINTPGFSAGEPLKAVSTHIGTGIADPGGMIILTYTPV